VQIFVVDSLNFSVYKSGQIIQFGPELNKLKPICFLWLLLLNTVLLVLTEQRQLQEKGKVCWVAPNNTQIFLCLVLFGLVDTYAMMLPITW